MINDKLTPAERARIRSTLEIRRAALRTEVKAQMEGSGDDRVVGLRNRLEETDDWAVADALAELDLAGLRHALDELTEVDAALARVGDDRYGVCTDCSDVIAPARLSAYPTATRCLECQQAHEAKPAGV